VANYNVDIAVVIKGNEKINKFNESLKKTTLQVKQLNDFLKTFQQGGNGLVKSFNNLNGVLASAKTNFNAVASGTKLQEKAARQLIAAEKELNKELKQREGLLRRLSTAPMPLPGSGVGSDPVAKSIRRRRRKLAGNSQAYSSPISPVQASQLEMIPGFGMGSLQGQSSPVGDRIAKALENEKRLVKEVEAIRGRASKKRAANTKRQLTLEKRSSGFVKKSIKEEAALRKKADAEEAKRANKRRIARQRIGGTISSAAIGGAFPLLFGQTGAAAVGGGLGGLAGGAIGGQFGFALSIVGTALGSAVDKADKFNKSLVELNTRMGTTGSSTAITAKEVDRLAKSLNITKEEVFNVLGAFREFGSGEIAKSMAMIFGTDSGGADRFAALDRSAKLAQEIFDARKQIGNIAAKDLLIQNQSLDAAVIELALVKAKAKAEQDAAIARARAVSPFDQFRANTPGLLLLRQAGKMKITDYGEIRAQNLQKKFNEENITLLENYKKGMIEARELLDLLRESQGQFGQSGTLAFSSINDKVKDLQDEMKKLANPIYMVMSLSNVMATSFEDSFKGIIRGTMSVTDAFRNMLNRIADHFLDTAARMLANQFQQGLLGLFGNLFTGGLGGGGIDLTPEQQVSRFTYGRADGGSVKGGNSYIVGERGPELFSPGVSGMITPNEMLGGGSTNIVVNVDASGSSVEGDEENGRELGRMISVAIQSELIKQKRPGGLLT
jgi:hypothetical protein